MNERRTDVDPMRNDSPAGCERLGWGLAGSLMGRFDAAAAPSHELSTFQADITPPLGHALMGGHRR